MDYPRITLVTPSFNQAQYLEETIQSVINQKYPNLEYIVLDGGSTDGSIEIIKKYSQHISYWLSKPDDGQADAIYKGFNRASGEIISWLNSDDLLCKNALFKVADHFIKNRNLGLIFGDAFLIDENSKLKNFLFSSSSFDDYKYGASGIFQGSVFYTKEAYEKAGRINPNLNCAMEYELFFKIYKLFDVQHISDFIGCYRIHPLAKSSNLKDIARRECESIFANILGINLNSISYKSKRAFLSLTVRAQPSFLIKKIFLKKYYKSIYSELTEHCLEF